MYGLMVGRVRPSIIKRYQRHKGKMVVLPSICHGLRVYCVKNLLVVMVAYTACNVLFD